MISVIIPIYNRSHTLRRAIDSVLRQTYRDFELILVDDGSTDNSLEICREYAAADSRVKVFHSENRGVSHARNLGLRQASGKYIRFVDSDDELPERSLEYLIGPALENDAVELVVARMDGGTYKIPAFSSRLLSQREYLRQFFRGELRALYYGPWNKLYLKSVLSSNSLLFDESLHWGEDALFNFSYYTCITSVYLSNRLVYHVHRPPGEPGHLTGVENLKLEDQIGFALMMNGVYRRIAAQIISDYDSACATILIDSMWKRMRAMKRGDYPALKDAVFRHDWEELLAGCQVSSFYWGYRFLYRCLIKKRVRRMFCFFLVKNRVSGLLPYDVKKAVINVLHPHITRRKRNHEPLSR